MSDATWSDARVATLAKLWADGFSAAQIAKRLGGVTRNAVIGKVHRLGLSGRGAPSRPARPARVSVPRRRRPARPAPAVSRPLLMPSAAVVDPAADAPGLVRDVTGLTAHADRWPIGDPKAADFSFCGRVARGRYCAVHERLSVQPGSAWRADRDPVVRRALAGLI
jgi:GcrA cell cycle regulator